MIHLLEMRGGSDGVLAQLSALFPNVPVAVIREHVAAADTIDDAAESLLGVAHEYAHEAPDVGRAGVEGATVDIPAISDDAAAPEAVDAATWTKDQGARERLFAQRRQHMLALARRRFLAQEQRRADA